MQLGVLVIKRDTRVRDSSEKPTARHERGLVTYSPTTCPERSSCADGHFQTTGKTYLERSMTNL